MKGDELRKNFLDFFAKKGHVIMPSSSLMPDDPSVLLTTAGMQQFKKYFLGEADPVKDFGAKRVASIQKCFRTSDIDEVGDESHLTFFEMLGHFSFGDYFKKETIEWTYSLLTEIFAIAPERISATVFAGDEIIPFDKESYEAWSRFVPLSRIRKGLRADNLWGPAGPEGPCGEANEVYVDNLEVATLVFMEYFCAQDGSLSSLPQKGVDVGWGFERLAMILQGKKNIFATDLFAFLSGNVPSDLTDRAKRIIGDHARAIVFLVSDGVVSSNRGGGYILRRLMRRFIVHSDFPGLGSTGKVGERYELGMTDAKTLFASLCSSYENCYPALNADAAFSYFEAEYKKFGDALRHGVRELGKIEHMNAADAFRIYESYGIPLEAMNDLFPELTKNLSREQFDKEFKKHQEISRAGAEKKFGGHGLLLDTGELKARDDAELQKVTRLHTATHLLHAALRKILGESIQQMGSDITAERTRFDFSFDRKLTDGERKKIEDAVNDIIQQGYDVTMQEMPYQEAIKQGALHFFKEKYPERVKVYQVEDFSKELCGGPHVQNTKEIGCFRIFKEEAVAAGVRRIRARVE